MYFIQSRKVTVFVLTHSSNPLDPKRPYPEALTPSMQSANALVQRLKETQNSPPMRQRRLIVNSHAVYMHSSTLHLLRDPQCPAQVPCKHGRTESVLRIIGQLHRLLIGLDRQQTNCRPKALCVVQVHILRHALDHNRTHLGLCSIRRISVQN